MTAYTDFLADPQRDNVWLAEITGKLKSDGSSVTYYYASAKYGTRPSETPASQRYDARMLGGYSFRAASVPPGSLGLMPLVEGGSIRLAQKFGDLDATFEAAVFDGGACVIRHGGTSRYGRLAHADFGVVFNGEIDRVDVGMTEVEIFLRERTSIFDAPLEDRVFPGSTYCMAFDGSTGSVSCGSPAKLDLQDEITIEGWFYFASFAAVQTLVGWGGTAFPFELYTGITTGLLRFGDSTGALALITGGQLTMSTGRWLHVAVVVDASGATFYRHDAATGVEASFLVSGSFLSRPAASSATLYLGSKGATRYFDGLMREVRIWSSARTAAEIRGARHRKLTAAEQLDANLAGYWRGNEGTGTAVEDLSASPADGTISGTVDWLYSLGGGDELEGQVLPAAFGEVYGIEPPLVEPRAFIYQVHSRAVEEITEVQHGGNPVDVGDAYTDLPTFLAATTAAGEFDTLIYAGGSYFRLGSSPATGGEAKPITAHVKGDAGSDGASYVSTGGAIVRRIVTQFGPSASRLTDPDGLNTTSFSDLDTANGAACGVWVSSKTSRGDICGYLLATLGAVAWFQRADGKLKVLRIASPSGSAVLDLTERDIAGGLRPVRVEAPLASLSLRYRRCHRVLAGAEFAAILVGTEAGAFFGQEWREVTRTAQSVADLYGTAAQTAEIDTAFADAADAATEADRRLALLDERGRAWSALCRSRAFQLDRFDVVSLTYQDFDQYGAKQYRANTSGSPLYYVLGVEEDSNVGSVDLTLWRAS